MRKSAAAELSVERNRKMVKRPLDETDNCLIQRSFLCVPGMALIQLQWCNKKHGICNSWHKGAGMRMIYLNREYIQSEKK